MSIELHAGTGTDRAAQLRAAFDSAFAEPLRDRVDTHVEVLSIVVGTTRYGLHLSEVLAVVADKPITPIPSPTPALLGLAGFRGSIVSVYDLAALAGETGGGAKRWIVLCAAAPSIALAFERFEGHLRADLTELASADGDDAATEVLRTAEGTLPLISIARLLTSVQERASTGGDTGSDGTVGAGPHLAGAAENRSAHA